MFCHVQCGVWSPEGLEQRLYSCILSPSVEMGWACSLLISISLHPTTGHGKYLFNTNLGRLWLSILLGFVVGLQQIFQVPPLSPLIKWWLQVLKVNTSRPWEERADDTWQRLVITRVLANSRYVSLQKHNQVKISERWEEPWHWTATACATITSVLATVRRGL